MNDGVTTKPYAVDSHPAGFTNENRLRELRVAMSERRSSARQKSFLQGRVFYNNRRTSADCLVRDVSARGARLVFADAITVPDVVELYLSNKDAIQRATVQWRRGNEIGVGFGIEYSSDMDVTAPPDMSARLLKLENECASLRRIVNNLQAEMRKFRSETV